MGIQLPALETRTPSMPETVDAFSRLIGLRIANQQQAEQAQQFQEAQQDRAKVQAAFQEGAGDPSATLKALLKQDASPQTIATVTNALDQAQKGALALSADQRAQAQQLSDKANGAFLTISKLQDPNKRQAAWTEFVNSPDGQLYSRLHPLPAAVPENDDLNTWIGLNQTGSAIMANADKQAQLANQKTQADAAKINSLKPTDASLALAAANGDQTAQAALQQLQGGKGISSVPAEIAAQLGPVPTTSTFGGKDYGSVAAAQAAWGQAVEAIKNREAAVQGQSRGQGFELSRPIPVYSSDGAKILGEWVPSLNRAIPAPGVSKDQLNAVIQQNQGLAPKITSPMLYQGEMSQTVIPMAQNVIGEIQSTAKALGPEVGRWNDFMTGKIGAKNPQVAQLQTNLKLLATAIGKAHFGNRAPEGVINDLYHQFSLSQSPDNLIARINGANTWLSGYAEAAGYKSGQSKTQAGPTTGDTREYQGHTYKFDGKQWVRQ